MNPIGVLVVDDSALMRQLLTGIIDAQPDMRVVGTAENPVVAREMIKALSPQVLTLDVEMPLMNGLDFLERLMRLRPMPVIMVSSLTSRGSDMALRALELGAVDVVGKPRLGNARSFTEYAYDMCAKIRAAASVRTFGGARPAALRASTASAGPVTAANNWAIGQLVAIGASTGGTEALRQVLTAMPPDVPPIVVVQHMPEGFTRSFAQRLDAACAITVSEASDGEEAMPGHAYIAPGHAHLQVAREGMRYRLRLSHEEPVNRHRPAVDVLFHSVAVAAGDRGVGAILTGMGRDGAAGMKAMRDAGARTCAQNEASCVVFGMPREAIALGAAGEVVTLEEIGPCLLRGLRRRHTGRLMA